MRRESARRPTIEVHIERIVVHGADVSRSQRVELADAVARHLTEQLAAGAGPGPAGGAQLHPAEVGRLRLAPLAGLDLAEPRPAGRQVGRALGVEIGSYVGHSAPGRWGP
jgi:hypothetical protein